MMPLSLGVRFIRALQLQQLQRMQAQMQRLQPALPAPAQSAAQCSSSSSSSSSSSGAAGGGPSLQTLLLNLSESIYAALCGSVPGMLGLSGSSSGSALSCSRQSERQGMLCLLLIFLAHTACRCGPGMPLLARASAGGKCSFCC